MILQPEFLCINKGNAGDSRSNQSAFEGQLIPKKAEYPHQVTSNSRVDEFPLFLCQLARNFDQHERGNRSLHR